MGLFASLRSWWPGRRAESRSIAGSESWITTPSLAGVVVTEETAPTFGAVYSCLLVLSSDVSAIPFQVVRREPSGGRSVDHDGLIHGLVCHSPDEQLSSMSWIGAKVWHLNTHGNAYSKILRDRRLRPAEVVLLDPRKVRPLRNRDGRIYYDVEGELVLAEDMIHVANVGFDGLVGKSPIRQCMETLGLGMAAEKFGAAYYGNGTNAKGILTTPNELDQVERDQLRKEIQDQHGGPYNAHRFMLLQGGLTFTPTTIPADEAQFIATRKFQLEECCRIFRVPPTKVQNLDRANFANLEEVNLDYYDSSLKPWARRFEVELTRKLFTRDERRTYAVEHDTSSLLKGRVLDQANADKLYREMGVSSADEIRALRNRGGPIEGGRAYLVPLNMAPLDKVAAASLETLKGAKAAAAPKPDPAAPVPPEDDPQGEAPAPKPEPDGRALDALRAVVAEVARRMARRESNIVRKVARRASLSGVLEGLDEFYLGEPATLAEAYGPALRAWSAVAGGEPIDPDRLASDLVAASRRDLLKAIEGPDTARRIVELADRWEADRPAFVLTHLTNPPEPRP
jgi:HK97 family phage portal protein